MRRVALVLGFLGVACAARFGPIYDDGVAGPNEKPLAELFDVWVAKHGKSYMDSNALGAKEEYTKRLGIFTTNWHFVAKLAGMVLHLSLIGIAFIPRMGELVGKSFSVFAPCTLLTFRT
mmetsp:Transcript_9358/g.16077  ORF Transcript_9358/g.16077 Transcript_9358/m.16077 type:complete len:119 (+) Transcript_9358:105-461(+)